MGRQRKLRFLPKVTSTATFLSPPPSPIRVDSRKPCSSPPVVSLVPKEVRRRGKDGNFEAKEPTSPKVSCMGQVTCKNKLKKEKKKKMSEEKEDHGNSNTILVPFHRVVIKIFKAKSHERGGQESPPGVPRALSLGHTKQFSSGRGVLQNFDWKAQDIGDGSCHDGLNHCEYGRREHQVEEEVIALEPRKDVNLWKRRNMYPPKPLKL